MALNFIKILTAVPLSSELKSALESKLLTKFGSGKTYQYETDVNILAGIVIQVDDIEYHYDLRDQINFIMLELFK